MQTEAESELQQQSLVLSRGQYKMHHVNRV